VLFTGEYEHTIDAKQRLAIPAELRSQLDPEIHGQALYLAPGANGALWIWPETIFERMASLMEQSLLPGEEIMELDALIFPQSRRLEIDKAGRVRIPEAMLEQFGLGQTVVILGMKDHLELRDPAQWEAQKRENLAQRRDIMMRARQAMASQHNQPNGGLKERP
jgi:MraZ protein